jgi:hypothetical protein
MNLGNLRRDTLVKTMKARPHRLVVVMTDCCANFIDVDVAVAWDSQPPQPEPLTDLLLRHSGVVDITSSHTGLPSRGTSDGGLFTLAFCRALHSANGKELDENQDGFVSWGEFFLTVGTETMHSALKRHRLQIPQAFSLGSIPLE